MDISTIGIDLSKTTFHVIGLNTRGEIVLRRKFSRKQLLQFTSNRQQMLIGMEACGGAHFLGHGTQGSFSPHHAITGNAGGSGRAPVGQAAFVDS